MKVKQVSAIDLLTTMGYKTASKWDLNRVAKKLNELKDEVTEKTELPTRKNQKALLDKILETDQPIRVVDADGGVHPPSKGEAPKTDKISEKKDKKAKKTKKVKKTKKTSKRTTGEGSDKYGSRIGSNNQLINACLSRKAKTMAELCKEAKIEGTTYTHFTKMIEKGVIERTEKGFRLIK